MRVTARKVRKNGLQLGGWEGSGDTITQSDVDDEHDQPLVHMAGEKPPVIACTNSKKKARVHIRRNTKRRTSRGVLFWSLGA